MDIVEQYKSLARKKAISYTAIFDKMRDSYGHTISKFAGDAPPALCIGHASVVNPSMAPDPQYVESKRGFMMTPVNIVTYYGVKLEDLKNINMSIYLWSRDLNDVSLSLYTTNKNLFDSPNLDFWSVAYLRAYFGEIVFNQLWRIRDKTKTSVLDGILYGYVSRNENIKNWKKPEFLKTLMGICLFVIELARRGGVTPTIGWGSEPTNG